MVPVAAVLKTRWRQSSLFFRAILKGDWGVLEVLLWYLPRDVTPFYRGTYVLKGLQG